jgi:hypothetical protein
MEPVSSSLPEVLPAMNEAALNKLRLTPWLYDVKKPWLAVVAKDEAFEAWPDPGFVRRALLAWVHCD